MADITKCLGEGCLLKAKCRRAVAASGQMQSWAMFDKVRAKQYGSALKCDFFLPVGEQDDKK
jgi:hypothetical protein